MFFSAWHPAMAYVFGYWLADGNMHHQPSSGGYLVSIGSKDIAHLAALRELVGAGRIQPIAGTPVAKLVISRKALYEELRRLGGAERKSLTLAWPEGVPAACLPHLVRGYVDGDGSLGWHRSGRSVHPLIGVVGAQGFIASLTQTIDRETGIPAPQIHPHSRVSTHLWRAAWYGIAAKCLAAWLYIMHEGPALPRKAAIAEAFAAWEPKVIRRGRITAKMKTLFQPYLSDGL